MKLNLNELSEVLNYGTADDLRACLESIADSCAEFNCAGVDELIGALRQANDTAEALDAKNDELLEDRNNYREFFFDCFSRLDGAYPCPSVTSDYDKGIIFEAIEGGAE
jgi:hypothetical protein